MLVRGKSGESWFLRSLKSRYSVELLCIIALNLNQTHALGINPLIFPSLF